MLHKEATAQGGVGIDLKSTGMLLRKDRNGKCSHFNFLLSPDQKSAGAVIYSVSFFHMTTTHCMLEGEAFYNFIVAGIVWTFLIRSSALIPYSLPSPFCNADFILEFCLGQLGKTATIHPHEHKTTE